MTGLKLLAATALILTIPAASALAQEPAAYQAQFRIGTCSMEVQLSPAADPGATRWGCQSLWSKQSCCGTGRRQSLIPGPAPSRAPSVMVAAIHHGECGSQTESELTEMTPDKPPQDDI